MDYCIDENEPKVERALLHVYKKKQFSDVTVICSDGNRKFYVHKLILALFSPVLSDRFQENPDCDTIDIEGVSLPAVDNLIRFCYGEPLLFKSVYEIKETKILAKKYEISELCNICIKESDIVQVDTSNVITVLELCIEDGNKNKETQCFEVISRDPETVFTSIEFMNMEFEDICNIFDKLREMNTLTEVQYLRSALRWMSCYDDESKSILLKKIDLSKLSIEEFVDIIIFFPTFFTSTEIAKIFQAIKSVQKTLEIPIEQNGSSSELNNSALAIRTFDLLTEQVNERHNKKTNIIIAISDGIGSSKIATIRIKDEISTRALQFEIQGYLKDGIFKRMSRKKDVYMFNDMNITYDGLYFMIMYANEGRRTLSPLNYIDVLKTATFFRLHNLFDACVKEANDIIDCEPTFLDSLLQFQCFQDLVTSFMIVNTERIILHPNFINCSHELISKIFSLPKLHLPSELQLLFVAIWWLEARNQLRLKHRLSLLNEIAFENIEYSELVDILKHYPGFFTDNEINSIFSYKKTGYIEDQESLPKWYNFKAREYIL